MSKHPQRIMQKITVAAHAQFIIDFFFIMFFDISFWFINETYFKRKTQIEINKHGSSVVNFLEEKKIVQIISYKMYRHYLVVQILSINKFSGNFCFFLKKCLKVKILVFFEWLKSTNNCIATLKWKIIIVKLMILELKQKYTKSVGVENKNGR